MVRVLRLYQTSIGKKAVMGVTGLVLFGFVILHMLGNLQVYLGPATLNAYGAFLKGNKALLWGMRGFLLLMTVLHVVAAIQIAMWKRRARPQGYVKTTPQRSTYASRTMMLSGPLLLAFIVYHLLHFTVGSAHPAFSHTDVYSNVVIGFSSVPVSVAYIVSMAILGTHLVHGAGSFFQSLGVAPNTRKWVSGLAKAATAIIVLGNISIPISVMAGLVK